MFPQGWTGDAGGLQMIFMGWPLEALDENVIFLGLC